MVLFYKTKILISGLFPVQNLKIDEFIEKTCLFNEKDMDLNSEDFFVFSTGHLLNSLYCFSDRKENFYEVFETEEKTRIEVNDNDSKEEIQHKIMNIELQRVKELEKKIRLLTGFPVTLPLFFSRVYDANDRFFTKFMYSSRIMGKFSASKYDPENKKMLVQRLNMRISNSWIKDLEEKNIRFKRALYFYNWSFNYEENGIRFILLVTSLESLFNVKKKKVKKKSKTFIKKEISSAASKILFLSKKQEADVYRKLKNYYGFRSDFIHGNKDFEIKDYMVNDLKEYVREILLIYLFISHCYQIYDASSIKKLILNTTRDELKLEVQMFIKYMRTPCWEYGRLFSQIKSEFLNGNTNVLSNKNID